MQFPSDVRPFIVKGLDMVETEDLADADRLQAEDDHRAQGGFTPVQVRCDLLEVGQQSRAVNVGDVQEMVFDRPPFSSRGREDAVETVSQEIVVLAAFRRGVRDVGQKFCQRVD